MKSNWFWGILIVILISWIGNIIYFELHQLKEPVVLDAYIDIQTEENTNISLYYLTNSSEVVELESLIAKEYTYRNEQNYFPWFGDVSAQSYIQDFTHQYLKESRFTFDDQSLKQVIKGFQDDELFARFTNGQVVPIQLEKLKFRTRPSQTNFITSKAAFGSNQGIQGELLEATETVRMDAIVLPNSLIDQVELKVQLLPGNSSIEAKVHQIADQNWGNIDAPLYTDIEWPLEIQKGDSVTLVFHLKHSNSYIHFVYDWSGITESKKAFTQSFPLLVVPNLSNQEVVDIVQKARGEQK